MNEPLWIPEEIVRVIHQDQIRQHGGSLGVRDENLLAASLLTSCTWRLKPQLYKQNLPSQVTKPLIFRQSAQADLVCIACEFYSLGLKLTLMDLLSCFGKLSNSFDRLISYLHKLSTLRYRK